MSKNEIIVITGVMAAGKSTVAELLAQKYPKAVHLRGDSFRRMIVTGREEMADPPTDEALAQLDLRYRLTAQAAKAYASGGFTVVVQDNYLGLKLAEFVPLFAPHPVHVAALCPSAQAIKKREAGRAKTGYTGFAVEQLHDMFMQTTPKIGYWLDSSNMDAQETAQAIYAWVESQAQQP